MFDVEYDECGVYFVDGDFIVDGMLFVLVMMVVFELGVIVVFVSVYGVCVMLFGGVYLLGEWFIEWNFVLSECVKIDVVCVVWVD